MRKIVTVVGLVVALAVPTVALAATLDTGKFAGLIDEADKCALGATYHFVNNQLGNPGVADGTLTATIGGDVHTTGPSLNNGPTQHFYVTADGLLTAASTNLGGKLVLSSIECKKK